MEYPVTPLNKLKRAPHKASYQSEEIYAILDECEICHIAFMVEGKAMVQPINFGRFGNFLYIHGAIKNRMTSALIDSGEVCVNVMILDSMKLTRSAFHHSVNYRSVNVFGKVRELIDHDEKMHGLKAIINHFVPDRWNHCRLPNEKELRATKVLEIEILSASAKIATAPPNDKEMDLSTDYWAGSIPVKQHLSAPYPVANLRSDIDVPTHILDFVAKKNEV